MFSCFTSCFWWPFGILLAFVLSVVVFFLARCCGRSSKCLFGCCCCKMVTTPPKHQETSDLSRTYGAVQEGTQHSSETSGHAEGEKLIEEKERIMAAFDSIRRNNEQLIADFDSIRRNNEQLMADFDSIRRNNERLMAAFEFLDARFYRENVVFDPETAHPRLEVFEDGKCVKETGNLSHVFKSKERFDSHRYILAKNGFSKGKHYWEVEVGEKKDWVLGVASGSICRQGIITLSPQNGYWVIKLEGGKEYWAQDSRLSVKVNEKPTKIGVFLNISDKSLFFYDVNRKIKLYTFTDSFSGKLYPFFSTGLETDTLPLRIPSIPSYFEEEED